MKLYMPPMFSQRHLNINYRFYGLVLLFAFFLMPVSFWVRGDNVSGNYSFILFPIVALFFNKRLQLPSKQILSFIAIYIVIFVACLIYQYDYAQFWDRRFISFIIFMSVFTFFFVKIDENMCDAFKYAIILISILYSLNSIFHYFIYKSEGLGLDKIRYHVESQRYGFILLFGFWLLIFEKPNTTIKLTIKLVFIFVVFNGLGLTFSRSSVAGLLVSSGSLFLLYFLNINFYTLKSWPYKNIAMIIFYIAIGVLFITISYYLIPDYFYYIVGRLFKISITPTQPPTFFPYAGYPLYETIFYHFYDTSEGYRIFMITEIFKFLSEHPLFGSGFLGVWIMYENLSAASHNQLLDVLFRTGLIGFMVFLYLLYRVIKYNFRSKNWAAFVTLMGILAIGLFHETFKLSQGAFLLSFMAAQAFSFSNIKLKQ
jgi:hypothetical protein